MTRFASLAAPGLLALTLFAGAPGPATHPSEVVLLTTTDVRGRLVPCACRVPRGGLARLAGLADRVAAARPALWLDAGSRLAAPGAPPEMGGDDAAADALLLGALGRHAGAVLNVGETELARGAARLRARARAAGVTLVASNLRARAGASPGEACVVTSVAGHPVGVIGLLAPEATLGPARDSLVLDDPERAARAAVATLRARRVHAIVLLSALGLAGTERVVRAVDGIDLAVVGRGAPLESRGRTLGRTALVCAGEQGYALGVSRLAFDPVGRLLAIDSGARPVDADVREQAATAAAVAAYRRARGLADPAGGGVPRP